MDARTRGSVRTNATAVVFNVLAVNGSASSLLTVFPSGTGRPLASNLNVAAHVSPKPNASDLNLNPGGALPNLVVVSLASGARVGHLNRFNALGNINAVLDVEDWFQ